MGDRWYSSNSVLSHTLHIVTSYEYLFYRDPTGLQYSVPPCRHTPVYFGGVRNYQLNVKDQYTYLKSKCVLTSASCLELLSGDINWARSRSNCVKSSFAIAASPFQNQNDDTCTSCEPKTHAQTIGAKIRNARITVTPEIQMCRLSHRIFNVSIYVFYINYGFKFKNPASMLKRLRGMNEQKVSIY